MRAFFLLCAFLICCYLNADERTSSTCGIPTIQREAALTDNAPVNTRLSEYSELTSVLNQEVEADENDAEALPTLEKDQSPQVAQEELDELFVQKDPITFEELQQEEVFIKALYADSLSTYKHYFFGPANYKVSDCLRKKLENGSYMVLSNGSVWKMAEADFWKIASWGTKDRLQLTKNHQLPSRYPYIVNNLENGERIRAIVRVGPQYGSPQYCACVGLCVFSGDVWCSNETMWWVAHEDCRILATWKPEDVIMVGMNDDFMRRLCPYMLFNLTNRSCCRAAWTH